MQNENLQFIDLTIEELIYLRALVKTQKHYNVPTHMYHYGMYAEQRVCINKNNHNMWEVYKAERGSIHSKKTFGTFLNVCLELLEYGVETKEEYNKRLAYFIKEESKTKKRLSEMDPENLIRAITKTKKK